MGSSCTTTYCQMLPHAPMHNEGRFQKDSSGCDTRISPTPLPKEFHPPLPGTRGEQHAGGGGDLRFKCSLELTGVDTILDEPSLCSLRPRLTEWVSLWACGQAHVPRSEGCDVPSPTSRRFTASRPFDQNTPSVHRSTRRIQIAMLCYSSPPRD